MLLLCEKGAVLRTDRTASVLQRHRPGAGRHRAGQPWGKAGTHCIDVRKGGSVTHGLNGTCAPARRAWGGAPHGMSTVGKAGRCSVFMCGKERAMACMALNCLSVPGCQPGCER